MMKTRFDSKTDIRIWMWSKPYPDNNIIKSIYTGLKKQWMYSPKFTTALAETKIELTGSRKKDYKIAEQKTGIIHVGGKTVWHHVWEEDATGYTMQLVDTRLHQETIPHAGGCKKWELKHNKKYRNSATKHAKISTVLKNNVYQDYVLDYRFEDSLQGAYYKNMMSANIRRKFKRKSLKLFGMDPYGNTFWKTPKNTLYFLDHESGLLQIVDSIEDNTN